MRLAGVLLCLQASGAPPTEEWPQWRGIHGNNHCDAVDVPLRWGPNEGIAWSASVPGRGHASPCVVAGQVVLATAVEDAPRQLLVSYDAADGRERWRCELHDGAQPAINAKNTHASATPASDGRTIFHAFVADDRLWLAAVALDGQMAWRREIGAFKHANGFGASPTIFGDLVIVASENSVDPAIVAFRRADGSEAWRTKRPPSDNSATPIVGVVAGRPQLLINGALAVVSYDPGTGEELWRVAHKTEVAACTMTFGGDYVYASGNVPEPLLACLRADGAGDVTATHVVWQTGKSITYVPSPLLVGDQLVTVVDGGIALCYDATTGQVAWKKRLGGAFSASPLYADGHVFAVSEAGATYVFDVGKKFTSVGRNDLGETCLATPAIVDGAIYLRTVERLYCIRQTQGEAIITGERSLSQGRPTP